MRRVFTGAARFLDQRWIHFLLIAALMTTLAAAWHQERGAWSQLLDHIALDGYFELRGAHSPAAVAEQLPGSRDIILVEMRHSVPRPLLAKMLDKLRLAKVVAFDLILRDNETELSDDEKGWYQGDIARWRRDNAILARAMQAQKHVVLGTWPEEAPSAGNRLPAREKGNWLRPPLLLWRSAAATGHFKVAVDEEDQTVRTVQLWQNTPRLTPCLGLAIAQLARPRGLDLASLRASQDENGALLIDYVGGRACFEYASNRIVYERVLDLYEPEDFKDKIVIIGETGAAAKDTLTTPFGLMPGMQIHANIVATLLQPQGPLRPLSLAPSLAISLAACWLLVVSLLRWPLWAGSVVALSQIVLLFVLGAWILCSFRRVLGLSLPIMAVVLTHSAITLYEYRRARETLGKFIGREMVAQTLQVFSRLQLGGRTEEASAFFCDVRGYSALSESRSPQEMTRIINEYTGALAQVVKKHQGRLIDYQGDGVFVLFERALTGPGHATKAVRAALELQNVFLVLRQEWAARGAPELQIGIGIETGPMTIGIVGAPERMMFSALGHAVNVAARVQGLTQQCGYSILITQNTYQQVKTDIEATPCGSYEVKGLQQPVAVYGLLPAPKSDTIKVKQEAAR